ncbi:hypothetical protein F4808DRAFT_95965 [Astrocystis sublimbata]|nr:hypothetical protein F4808DRAFT_95965 [Astrocystis sublimbata]
MSLELFAGQAASMGLVNMTFAPRDAADFGVSKAALASRDGPSTVKIFIDSGDTGASDGEYAVSVVEACVSHTVYALACTAGSADGCGANAAAATVTENQSTYSLKSAVTTKSGGTEIKATVIDECQLQGTTKAICTGIIEASANGQKTSTALTTTYTNAAKLYYEASVTGGAEKLANPTGKCSSGASTTRAVALWGFLGAIGAVGVLAL